MTRARIAGAAFVIVILLLAVAVALLALEHDVEPVEEASPAIPPGGGAAAVTPESGSHPSVLYGRVSTLGGSTFEGRLRWGGGEEAFWGHFFNGRKRENTWAAHVPPEQLPNERRPIEFFGVVIAKRERPLALDRPFMACFGDITRIEAIGREVRVTLKSGTVFNLDRFEASDFDDGVRVWDGRRGVVDLDSGLIRLIELLPAPSQGVAPHRLHGTVRTRHGSFTGFLQWDRNDCLGTDELDGKSADGALSLRYDTIGSLERLSRDASLVTLLDGRELTLSGTREVGAGNTGCYVDDRRYGRVLISWDAFERVDFSPGGSGPAYDDFSPGRPLTGSVTTRDGRRLTGRLVYDLDESETSETLDAPSQGVNYTIPFGLISSLVPSGPEQGGVQLAGVTLLDGEELQLEQAGDLGSGNAGMLIFSHGDQPPEYLPWTDVERIEFDRPPEMTAPLGER